MKKNLVHPVSKQLMFLRVIKESVPYKGKNYLINFHFYESYKTSERYVDDICEAVNDEQIISYYRSGRNLRNKNRGAC